MELIFGFHVDGPRIDLALEALDGLARVARDWLIAEGLRPGFRIEGSVLCSIEGRRKGPQKVFLSAMMPAPETHYLPPSSRPSSRPAEATARTTRNMPVGAGML